MTRAQAVEAALKPCPFCGGDVHFSNDPDAHIVCMNPGCKLLDITFQASFRDFKQLAEQWNTRVGYDTLLAQLKAQGWQDMKSAPVNGTPILGLFDKSMGVVWCVNGDWYENGTDVRTPDAWMPLPQPPAAHEVGNG